MKEKTKSLKLEVPQLHAALSLSTVETSAAGLSSAHGPLIDPSCYVVSRPPASTQLSGNPDYLTELTRQHPFPSAIPAS